MREKVAMAGVEERRSRRPRPEETKKGRLWVNACHHWQYRPSLPVVSRMEVGLPSGRCRGWWKALRAAFEQKCRRGVAAEANKQWRGCGGEVQEKELITPAGSDGAQEMARVAMKMNLLGVRGESQVNLDWIRIRAGAKAKAKVKGSEA